MNSPNPPNMEDVVEITPEQLTAAIAALEHAEVSKDILPHVRIVLAASKTLFDIYSLLSMFRITIQQIRRRLGILNPKRDGGSNVKEDGSDVAAPSDNPDDESEPASDGCTPESGEASNPNEISKKNDENKSSDNDDATDDDDKKKRNEHGRRGKEDFPDAKQRYFAHPDFGAPGCECPDCLDKKVYLMGAVGGGIRFTGQPYLLATGINYEIWRCGGCGAHFPAPRPDDIQNDGNGRVGYSAAATIACNKYLYGTPWSRQESMSLLQNLEIPATTQWEHCLSVMNDGLPVYKILFVVGAVARLYYSDDTGARIIGVTEEEKTQRKTGKTVIRTGVHTSCVLAKLEDGREIVIYKTGIIHAGELLDEILINRPNGLPRPQHMSDGLSANPPTVCAVIPGDCNAHARRKVEDKQEQWPKVWIYIKSVYKIVYKADANAKKLKLNDQERLILHRKESLPVMKAMFVWMQECLKNKTVEPNSSLGGIFEYFLIREKSLMAFCYYPGFPIDNNICESAQKLVAQHRKNAEYYRTQRGALAADVIMSLGATAKKAGVNPHEYFIALQRYSTEVEKNPEKFLPWNYLATLKELDKGPPRRVLEVSEEEFYDRQKRLRSTKAWGKPQGSMNESPKATVAAI